MTKSRTRTFEEALNDFRLNLQYACSLAPQAIITAKQLVRMVELRDKEVINELQVQCHRVFSPEQIDKIVEVGKTTIKEIENAYRSGQDSLHSTKQDNNISKVIPFRKRA